MVRSSGNSAPNAIATHMTPTSTWPPSLLPLITTGPEFSCPNDYPNSLHWAHHFCPSSSFTFTQTTQSFSCGLLQSEYMRWNTLFRIWPACYVICRIRTLLIRISPPLLDNHTFTNGQHSFSPQAPGNRTRGHKCFCSCSWCLGSTDEALAPPETR